MPASDLAEVEHGHVEALGFESRGGCRNQAGFAAPARCDHVGVAAGENGVVKQVVGTAAHVTGAHGMQRLADAEKLASCVPARSILAGSVPVGLTAHCGSRNPVLGYSLRFPSLPTSMMLESRLLKKDLFGEVRLESDGSDRRIVRDAAPAALPLRWLANGLMRREARALVALDGVVGVPGLIRVDRNRLEREYLDGAPMHRARPRDAEYFRRAMRLLRQLHGRGVVHNDLAKEPNILVIDGGHPAFVDFQLAWHAPGRGRLFCILAYDDLRHLLKHKRSYCADKLTERERRILAKPSLPSRLWMRVVKPPYLFLTRKVLGWADREGASDRGERR